MRVRRNAQRSVPTCLRIGLCIGLCAAVGAATARLLSTVAVRRTSLELEQTTL